jgi:hypothetical protein
MKGTTLVVPFCLLQKAQARVQRRFPLMPPALPADKGSFDCGADSLCESAPSLRMTRATVRWTWGFTQLNFNHRKQ